jgi:hypothetical protein
MPQAASDSFLILSTALAALVRICGIAGRDPAKSGFPVIIVECAAIF